MPEDAYAAAVVFEEYAGAVTFEEYAAVLTLAEYDPYGLVGATLVGAPFYVEGT